MYPDLLLNIHRQQVRELEQQQLHRLAARDRSPVARDGSQSRIPLGRGHRRSAR